MSLFALPVTLSDIENLQQGIEFQVNVPEATLEVALINAGTQTVQSYANQLILNMEALSQVVMAVDSLMTGVVPSEAELTNLTVNFVPAQLAYFLALPPATQTGAGGPIVWDAEVTGFALTEKAQFTTNFAGLNTGAHAGTAGNAAFAAAVSTAIFGNASLTSQVLAYFQSFENFLTSNPAELTGNGIPLSDLVKAADALTFGTEVGIALSNPTTVGAFLEGLVTNALIANAEFLNGQGPSPVGVALGLIPPATPLQGYPVTPFTLTLGQDTVVTGQPPVLNGVTGTGDVPASNVLVNAPLVTGLIFGTTAPFPTLTTGDDINLSGVNNTLDATFNTEFFPLITDLVTNLTIEGVANWNLSNTSPLGGLVTLVGGTITSPTTLNYSNSLGDMQIGSSLGTQAVGLSPNVPLLNTIEVTNDAFLYGYQYLAISMKATDFTGSDSLAVFANGVGNGTPGQNNSGDWTDFGIIAGPTTGTVGYLNWTVNSGGGVSNNIELGAESATNATTLTINDDHATGTATYLAAATTDGSGPGNWANLTFIDASGTAGQLTVTGGELSNGLLASNTTAITTVYGGAGADVFDLTACTTAWNVSGVTINGNAATNVANTTSANFFLNPDDASGYDSASGAGTGTVVELNCDTINSISAVAANAFAEWTNVPTLYDVATGGGLGTVSGLINMADFPGTDIVTLANTHSGNYVYAGDISVTNAPDFLTFNFQDVQAAENFQIAGVSGVGDYAYINYGTGYLSTDPVDGAYTFVSTGIDNLYVTVWGASGLESSFNPVYLTGIVDVGNSGNDASGSAGTVLSIESNVGLALATDGTSDHLGVATLALFGGVETTELLPPFSSVWSETGTLDLSSTGSSATQYQVGVTNASTIDGPDVWLIMQAPGDDILYGSSPTALLTGISVTAEFGIIQGTLADPVTAYPNTYTETGNDTLTFTNASVSSMYGAGGADTFNLNIANDFSDTIFFGMYFLDSTQLRQDIGGDGYANAGFWGTPNGDAGLPIGDGVGFSTTFINTSGTSADMSVVNGFLLGTLADDDILSFNVYAWDHGNGTLGHGDLVQSTGTGLAIVPTGSALTGAIVSATGQPLTDNTDLICYTTLGTVANAAQLAADLSGPAGYFTLAGTDMFASGKLYDMLVAYGTGTAINIADVQFTGNGTGSTEGLTINASDMVQLVGLTSLLNLGTHIADIQFVHI